MKLIVAIVNYGDCNKLISELSKHHFGVTKFSTTGGFLRGGNKTLFIGVEDQEVDNVIEIIKQQCHSRKQFITYSDAALNIVEPVEINVGGATVFVLDVEKFGKF